LQDFKFTCLILLVCNRRIPAVYYILSLDLLTKQEINMTSMSVVF
jgi:hypothetical protein